MKPSTITILAAGDFPRRKSVVSLLDEADMVICCDRAAENLITSGRDPEFIVGDMDSISEYLIKRIGHRLRKISDQETNDLTKAFHVAMEYAPSAIHILGATGRREDHTLGNISLLLEYKSEAPACDIDMVSDYGRFVATNGQRTFQSVPGQEISIFAFDPTLRMSATGLEYPLDGVIFDSLWKATLNKATGSEFTLTPGNSSPYLVYFCNTGL